MLVYSALRKEYRKNTGSNPDENIDLKISPIIWKINIIKHSRQIKLNKNQSEKAKNLENVHIMFK